MPSSKLPSDFIWRQEQNEHTLYLDLTPIAKVLPVGGGLMVQSVLGVPGVEPLLFAVRSVENGKGSAIRWVAQRQRLIARACGRDDLAPPVVHGPPRRWYPWQYPSGIRAS